MPTMKLKASPSPSMERRSERTRLDRVGPLIGEGRLPGTRRRVKGVAAGRSHPEPLRSDTDTLNSHHQFVATVGHEATSAQTRPGR
jgi:hypothetical protein